MPSFSHLAQSHSFVSHFRDGKVVELQILVIVVRQTGAADAVVVIHHSHTPNRVVPANDCALFCAGL